MNYIISTEEARKCLSDLLDLARSEGQQIIITRHGRARAALVSYKATGETFTTPNLTAKTARLLTMKKLEEGIDGRI